LKHAKIIWRTDPRASVTGAQLCWKKCLFACFV